MARQYPLEKVRNIGIMAHIDAGKTTVSERILYYTGKTHKLGEVHDGKAIMDWMDQEQERGITITSAATTAVWKQHMINLIDTPGHVDFTVEVERSLRVLDEAIALFCAVGGIEPQSEMVWRQADKYSIPRIIFINKMDRLGADFYGLIDDLHKELHANAVPVVIPIEEQGEFVGIIDLVEDCAIYYNENDNGASFYEKEIPENLQKKYRYWKQNLLEKVSETDESLLEKFCADEKISAQEIRSTIKRATATRAIYPVLCGSAFKNKGIQRLLDAIIYYLPSPADLPAITAADLQGEPVEINAKDDAELAALAFKVVSDRHIGKLNYVRVYSGEIKAGSYVYNSTKNKKQRVGRVLKMHANHRENVDALYCGEIGAIVGLADTVTGNTICCESQPMLLESIEFPAPVISMAVKLDSKDQWEKAHRAILKIAEEDPSFTVSGNAETGDTIISGMGELHIEIIIERLKREFGVKLTPKEPQVAYKEAITACVKHEEKLVKQTGGKGQYAHIIFEIEPINGPNRFEFIDKVVGGRIPREYIPAIEKGVLQILDKGVYAGFPIMNMRFTLLDGSFHAVDSSEMAFRACAMAGFQKAFRKAHPEFQEPIMNVTVTTPEQYAGAIINTICSKRGQIAEVVAQKGVKMIKAKVPLANLFGYVSELRNMSQGRANFTMIFDHYQSVPYLIAEDIIAQRKAQDKEQKLMHV